MNQELVSKITLENIKNEIPYRSNKSSILKEKLKKLLVGREFNTEFNFHHYKNEIPKHLQPSPDKIEKSEHNLDNKQQINKNIDMNKNSINNSLNSKTNEDGQHDIKINENDCGKNKKNEKNQQKNELLKSFPEKKLDNNVLKEEKLLKSKDNNNDIKDLLEKIISRYNKKENQSKNKIKTDNKDIKQEK